ncbi:hypothetical protein AAY473_017504, partial [Plecturocebus cupreus]
MSYCTRPMVLIFNDGKPPSVALTLYLLVDMDVQHSANDAAPFFAIKGLALWPRLEYSCAFMTHCSLNLPGSGDKKKLKEDKRTAEQLQAQLLLHAKGSLEQKQKKQVRPVRGAGSADKTSGKDVGLGE